jgi:hypothetical protein
MFHCLPPRTQLSELAKVTTAASRQPFVPAVMQFIKHKDPLCHTKLVTPATASDVATFIFWSP